jgi:glycosyltransferase involved in cell wall biosynthesis
MNAPRKNILKVMHVVSRFNTGGMENGIVNLCNNLDRRRFQPQICCLKGLGSMVKRLNNDVQVFNMEYSEGIDLLRPIKFANFLRVQKPDIVHAHAWGMGSFEAIIGARLAGVPVVINGEHGAFFTKKYQIFIQRILSLMCNVTLSVSESLKAEIVNKLGISMRRILVIRNGVDTEKFTGDYDTTDIKKELSMHKEFFLRKDDFLVLVIGSLKPDKNQMLILQALILLNSRGVGCDLKVIFVGKGPQEAELITFVIDHGLSAQVSFFGERMDINVILGLANLLVTSSVIGFEGLPNVVLESMSSGVPVVATPSVGIGEIIKSEENGWILKSCNCDELADMLQRLILNRELVEAVGSIAQTSVRKSFSLSCMVAGYEKLYCDCINKRFS